MSDPSDLVDLATTKDWLGIAMSDTTLDARLGRLITAASATIARHLDRNLLLASYAETRDGTGTRRLVPTVLPLVSVSSLSIGGVAVQASSAPGLYGYACDAGSIWLNGAVFQHGLGNVALSYTAGFATLPSDIVQAAVLAVSAMSNAQGVDPNITSESVPGTYSATYKPAAGTLPDVVRDMLAPYRRVC